jgi:hypothetical protein
VWGQIISFISASVCIYLVLSQYPNQNRDINYTAVTALLLWLLAGLLAPLELFWLELISQIILIISNSLVLVVLLMIIRFLRPIVFQYPYIVVFVPLLIPVSYLVLMGVEAMQQIIIMITQGAGLLVAALLTGGHWNAVQKKTQAAAGFIGIGFAYLIYWVFPGFANLTGDLWLIILSLGMISFIYSFSDVIENKDKMKENK